MPKSKKYRIILDTNLWISCLISKRLNKIIDLFHQDNITLVFSEELLGEFTEVARRPKFKKYFSVNDIENLLRLFDVYGELINVISDVDVCTDKKDNFLLSLSKDGKADFLVTGDAHLLIIKQFEHTEILTYTEFELKIS